MLTTSYTADRNVRTVRVSEPVYRTSSKPDLVFDDGNGYDVVELKNPDVSEPEGIEVVKHEQKRFEFPFKPTIDYDGNDEAIALAIARRDCPEGWQVTGCPEFYEESGVAMCRVIIHKWVKKEV